MDAVAGIEFILVDHEIQIALSYILAVTFAIIMLFIGFNSYDDDEDDVMQLHHISIILHNT